MKCAASAAVAEEVFPGAEAAARRTSWGRAVAPRVCLASRACCRQAGSEPPVCMQSYPTLERDALWSTCTACNRSRNAVGRRKLMLKPRPCLQAYRPQAQRRRRLLLQFHR
jgi:hypothetical protein